jgi:iron complex transport system substrate-binding protein
MVDSVEMIRFFAEFILSVEPRSFVSLRMTSEGLRMTTIADSPIATQSQREVGRDFRGHSEWQRIMKWIRVKIIHNAISRFQFVIPGLTRNPVFRWIPAFAGMTRSTVICVAVYGKGIGKGGFFAILVLSICLLLTISAKGQDRIFTDEIGRKVKVPHSPRRIISLAPSITEMLFALGFNDKIAGVTNFCDYPEAASGKPKIGGFVNPSIEKIVSLKPDLIVAIQDGNRLETIERLTHLGFPVYVVDPKGWSGILKTIERMGDAFGKLEESKRIVNAMTKKKEQIVSLTRSLPSPKVFYQMGLSPVVTPGPNTLADDLIRLAGGKNIAGDEPIQYPAYNIETVMLKAPEVIILTSMEKERDYAHLVKMWQDWKNIPAVKRNAIYVIDSNIVDRPGPRVSDGLERLARIIHPEAFEGKK